MTAQFKGLTIAAALTASMLLPLGSNGIVVSQAEAANSAIYCQGYADRATRLYRDYQRKNCGNLVNTVWNPDYGTHYSYCMKATQNTTEWLQNLRYKVISNNCQN